MSDQQETIQISAEDILEANRLSLNCPICAGAVERNASRPEMRAVYCTSCETLYHLACREQNGDKCAVLGCDGSEYRLYGVVDLGPVLKIRRSDIPREAPQPRISPNGRTKRLKRGERRMQRELKRRTFWRDLWQTLLRAIKLWPSDPS